MKTVLELHNLGKAFGSFWALRGVNLCFSAGRVHALIGENGAGKSSLIKILAGVYPLSEGALMDGEGQEMPIKTPRDALKAGIGVVHQELDLFNNLTVAENISLSLEDHGFFKPSFALMSARAAAALEKLQERCIKPWMRVGDLSTSDKQLVAIAKVLEQFPKSVTRFSDKNCGKTQELEQFVEPSETKTALEHFQQKWTPVLRRKMRKNKELEQSIEPSEIKTALEQKARIIILDEPTSALNAAEASRLLACVAHLKAQGVAIIYVSHKLGEIFSIADEISILRDGQLVLSQQAAGLKHSQIVAAMLGRDLAEIFPSEKRARPKASRRQILLQVENLVGRQLSDVSLTLEAGEIVALAGLPDAGPSALLRHIFGLQKPESGCVVVREQAFAHMTPRRAISLGLAYLPADRLLDGILPLMDVLQNTQATDEAMGMSPKLKRRERALSSIKQLGVKAPSLREKITSLSGGNQQKTLLARWLSVSPCVLMLDDPTRGVDIGAKSEIYHILHQLRRQGVAIVFTSSDSLELAHLADRILLFRQGKIIDEIQAMTG